MSPSVFLAGRNAGMTGRSRAVPLDQMVSLEMEACNEPQEKEASGGTSLQQREAETWGSDWQDP